MYGDAPMSIGKYLAGVLAAALMAVPAGAEEPRELSAADMALGFYQPLAEEGSPYAQLVIGEMYLDGNGVPRDYVQAYAWFYVSADQGVDEALPLLDKAWRELSTEQQDQAEALAKQYVERFRP